MIKNYITSPIKENFSKKVELTLALDKCSLKHSVELTPAEAMSFAEHGESYNNLNRDAFRNMIIKINSIVPRMNFPACNGHPNPNNGQTFHTFEIGNEGSRVVYVNVVKFYLQNKDEVYLKSLSSEIEAAGKSALADEIKTIQLCGSFQVRLWWD